MSSTGHLKQLIDRHAAAMACGGTKDQFGAMIWNLLTEYETLPPDKRVPIPMILFCPSCHERHIDVGEFTIKEHHTHACQHCGFVWRPALVATVGVQFLPGFKDKVTP